MADPQVHISTGETGANDSVGDIEMGGDEGVESVEVEETAAASNGGDVAELSQEESNPPRTTFIEYVLDSLIFRPIDRDWLAILNLPSLSFSLEPAITKPFSRHTKRSLPEAPFS